MAKILNAMKQKDKRTLKYDPEKDNTSAIINEFRAYLKETNYIKNYSELEKFEYFKDIRWMQVIDQKCEDKKTIFYKQQRKLKAKYENYIDYKLWSESPFAETTKPLTKTTRIIILSVFVIVFIAMLLIIIGLNKWW